MTGAEPLRVLQLNAGSRDFGGVSSFLYNVYTHIDRDKVQFDFLTPEETTYGIHRAEIEAMGGRILQFGITGSAPVKKLRLYARLKAFLRENDYSIVQINSGNFFFDLAAVLAARRAGTKHRVVHSHSIEAAGTGRAKALAIRALRPLLTRSATACLACSTPAGQFMFADNPPGGKVRVVHNGIDVARFDCDAEARARLRREYGLDGCFAVGQVGRFSDEKNQAFTLPVFAELAKRRPDARLVLVGAGPLEARTRAEAERLGIADRVLFLGQRADVHALYQMLDVLAFPSKFEGFGMVLVEAQISGLPCVASDRVPRETDVTGLVTYLPIGADDMGAWVARLDEIAAEAAPRRSYAQEVLRQGFDIRDVARQLQDFYLSRAEGKAL